MKGFGILLALASCAILLICGPPALNAGDTQNYSDLHSIAIDGNGSAGAGQLDLEQTPDACPAGLQVVPDPGSCGDLSEAVACRQLKNILPAVRPRNILRQGVRILTRLSCC